MIAQGEVDKIARKHRVGPIEIEKDYTISWILYGISKNEWLKSILAFKGGTALKKVYFEDYRFSEDLDFTLLKEEFSDEEIRNLFQESLEIAEGESGIRFEIDPDKGIESHASDSFRFYINYVAPLQGAMGSRYVKVDITRGEILEYELEERTVYAEYPDFEEEFKIISYSLSEIVIEKLTALMGRTIPRDIYDLWYLLEVEGMDITQHNYEFERKAVNKGHDPKEFNAQIAKKEAIFNRDWNASLDNQINDLPDFKEVMRLLKKHFRKLD